MNRILVIGFGNILRTDDGAGHKAVELLAKRLPEVDCIATHDLKPEFAELITNYQAIIFIDASKDCQSIEHSKLTNIIDLGEYHSHTLTPEMLLSLSKKIYNAQPEFVYLIKIPAINFNLGDDISPLTKESINNCVNWVCRLIKEEIKI